MERGFSCFGAYGAKLCTSVWIIDAVRDVAIVLQAKCRLGFTSVTCLCLTEWQHMQCSGVVSCLIQ